MNTYWETVWSDPDIREYLAYIKRYFHADWSFIKLFHEHGSNYICDAACGYGAFSALLSFNGFRTAGFDPIEKEDLALEHEKLEDGSFLYRSPERDGLLFHYYEDNDIETLLDGMSIIYRGKNNRNEREMIIKKEGNVRNGST